MKILNNTKKRKATPNEIAKAIIIDNLEVLFYWKEKSKSLENLSDEMTAEVDRHLCKHYSAIKKKLNLTDNINIW